MNYYRHTLCFLKPDAKPISPHSTEDRSLLAYWLQNHYPLIVTRQLKNTPLEHIHLALSLFDKNQMKKIRLRFLFEKSQIQSSCELPKINQLFPHIKTDVEVRVYGSYCWEHLTGLHCIRKSSDLDLLIVYQNESISALQRLYQQLSQALKTIPLDGEIRFPDFGDCAWLELIQEAFSPQILIKYQQDIALIQREYLYAQFPALIS
ncbi:MAG TPA: malonate decarboxylase holo-[acyl-carrier-protein] synthase [Legionellales bacterium]|nr:malonate decarboxylase holo-[acyl-carrier-protein] synthase [Legionellales bacterium]